MQECLALPPPVLVLLIVVLCLDLVLVTYRLVMLCTLVRGAREGALIRDGALS
jgi:hypothetical protein